MAKWVKPTSSFATGSSGRVTKNINAQNDRAKGLAGKKDKQDTQLARNKSDKTARRR